MPAMVGGFGKVIKCYIIRTFTNINTKKKEEILESMTNSTTKEKINYLRRFGPYLAGLIEGDGTFAIKNLTNQSSNYNPHIIVVFKIADIELANFLCNITGCGKISVKKNSNYVLWKITKILDVYVIVSVINGFIRTPKHETLIRYIDWYNNYISSFTHKVFYIDLIKLVILPIDTSNLSSNNWLSGFVDADGHFAISITKRKNGKIRIITRFTLEQRINYHRQASINEKSSYSAIILSINELFNGSMYTRSRIVGDKTYYSFVVIAHNVSSKNLVINYFDYFPLWSSKYFDYLDWKKMVVEQMESTINNNHAILVRKDFNNTRTTLSWDHLNSRII